MTFFLIFENVQGALLRLNLALAEPSTKRSILRKIASIKTVCGHAQPHHARPQILVTKPMEKTKPRTSMPASFNIGKQGIK